MTRSLDGLEAMLAGHNEQVLAEAGLSAVAELERVHLEDMRANMAAMENAQQSIERCADERASGMHAGRWRSMHDVNAGMGATMGSAMVETDRHHRAMASAAELAAMLEEERTHRANMEDLIEQMRSHEDSLQGMMQNMSSDGVPMMCSMGSHMH